MVKVAVTNCRSKAYSYGSVYGTIFAL